MGSGEVQAKPAHALGEPTVQQSPWYPMGWTKSSPGMRNCADDPAEWSPEVPEPPDVSPFSLALTLRMTASAWARRCRKGLMGGLASPFLEPYIGSPPVLPAPSRPYL